MLMQEIEKVGSPIHDRGPAQGVSHGRWVYPMDPRPEEIFIQDIANSLSKMNRFFGHTKDAPHSVAQHSVWVSHHVPPEFALEGLLHDGAETYIGDIARPMKKLFEIAAPGVLRELEDGWERALAERFGLAYPMPDCIKIWDNVAVVTEKRDLLTASDLDWGPMPDPDPEPIVPDDWRMARQLFLSRFECLKRI